MISSITKKRLACGLIAASLGASLMVGSASADPAQYNAFVGVGSDTTQDVLNALAGRSGNLLYTPVQSSAATGGRQLISFDATPPAGAADNCITPKLGAATFTRPNGSSAGRAQESDGPDLKLRGDALAAIPAEVNSQVIIGFSAGQFIARSNGVASPAPGPGVGIGLVSDNGLGANLGSPITGTAPTLAPNATFFNDNRFGRLVYNVFPTSIVTGPGNNDLKSLFVDQAGIAGNEATLCAATATINTFGFLTASNCGALGITGPLLAGQL